jgi:adenylate cyclase
MLDEIFDWLLDGAPGATSSADVLERLGGALAAGGIPIERMAVMVATLHPNVMGRAFVWERGKPLRVLELSEAARSSPEYKHSPIVRVNTTGEEWRWRTGEPDLGYDIIPALVKQGCVDYVCLPLRFTIGEPQVWTVSSNVGFTHEHVAQLRRMARPLARLAEILAMRRTAANILATYVGSSSGERVLAGRILRGDVEVIRAAIWFSDLRGFTAMSGQMSAQSLIATLNDVFECQVPAIEKRGGEVLKFIGDGLLAIFPITEISPPRARCGDALAAASESLAALAAHNATAGTDLRIGLALHVGEVAYGSIGSATRLDFTAIGPAVNLTARLEGITSKLGRTMVVSSEFAAAAGTTFEDLGEFELKGIATAQRVFG